MRQPNTNLTVGQKWKLVKRISAKLNALHEQDYAAIKVPQTPEAKAKMIKDMGTLLRLHGKVVKLVGR